MRDDRPVYAIGVVADIMNVHPETIRGWERHGIVCPVRRNGHRLYSNNDLRRLDFVGQLLGSKGLNLAGVRYYLTLYPCWWDGACPSCMQRSGPMVCAKPCWKEKGTYCIVSPTEPDQCATCKFWRADGLMPE